MANSITTSSTLEKPRRRLIRQYRLLGTYRAVADAHGVNVKFVYEFLAKGIIPNSKRIRQRLGIKVVHHKTINEHLATDSVQDMPADLLRWALENREEMK